MLAQGSPQCRKISLAECTDNQDQLHFRGALYVPGYAPKKLEIIKLNHALPSAGQPGQARTFELNSQECSWPKVRQYIEQYLRNCCTCRQAKPVRHSPLGLLKPLAVPQPSTPLAGVFYGLDYGRPTISRIRRQTGSSGPPNRNAPPDSLQRYRQRPGSSPHVSRPRLETPRPTH